MHLKHLYCLWLAFFLLGLQSVYAQCANVAGDTVFVTSRFNVAGSLRNAINCVNNPTNSVRFIHFNINDPGVITITPTGAAPLPSITKSNVVIDAQTQPGWFLGKVIIDGSAFSSTRHGLDLQGDNILVSGLTITGFTNTATGAGIYLQGNGATIAENALIGNRYGIHTASPSSFSAGDNLIGIDPVSGDRAGNSVAGISILTSALGTFTIGNNLIAHNPRGIFAASSLVDVLASQNSIYCNSTKGIERSGFIVGGFALTTASTTSISGTGPNGARVEVFIHDTAGCDPVNPPCQGKTFLGITTVTGGAWTLSLAAGEVQVGDAVTATATVGGDNTSEFLTCLTVVPGCPPGSVVFSNVQDACGGSSSGSATAAMDIAGSFAYEWSDGQLSATAINLSPADYMVTAIDAAGCSYLGRITINTLPEPTVSPTNSGPLCEGETLFLEANANGGTPPYDYNWTGPNSFASTEANPTLPNVQAVAAGIYLVTVRDANGCENTERTEVQVNEAPTFDLTPTAARCNGTATGSIDLTPLLITPPVTYAWSNGASTEDIENVLAGVYTVTVTDGNGCSTSTSGTISEPTPLLLSNLQTTPPSALGGTDGSLSVDLSGGTPPYDYSWTGPANGSASLANAGTATISMLAAGDYNLSVSDANGCVANASFTIAAFNCGFALSASTVTPVSCAGGTDGQIDLIFTNGANPITYTWDNGATTEDISGLTAGAYALTATDAAGCVVTFGTAISEPTPLLLSNLQTTPPSALGGTDGSLGVDLSGGTPPYDYSWTGPANGSASLVNAGTATISMLAAGDYNLSVSDANGCVANASFTIAAFNCGFALSASTVTPVSCAGGTDGQIDLTFTNGANPITYNWDNGATTEDISGLTAGAYALTATDAAGCVVTFGTAISEPTPLLLSNLQTTPPSALGGTDGSLGVDLSGGTPPYDYSWTGPANGSASLANTGTATISMLAAGDYNLSVSDANGCVANASFTIAAFNCGFALSASTVTPVSCAGGTDGQIDLTFTNGANPITYTWDNGATTEDISGLTAGAYALTATDAAGCVVTFGTAISEPTPLLLSNLQTTPPSALGGTDGSLGVDLSGGTPPYDYSWTGPANGSASLANTGTATISMLAAGDYNLSVSDANGCVANASFIINAANCNLGINAENVLGESCAGALDGSISLMVANGTPPYNYTWTNGSTSGSGMGTEIANLSGASYEITLSDQANCSATASVVVMTTTLSSPNTTISSSCDTGNGTAVFDLSALATSINPDATLSILWFEDATGSTPVTSPSTYSSADGSVYAATSRGSCLSALTEIQLVVLASTDPACGTGGCTSFAGTFALVDTPRVCSRFSAVDLYNDDAILDDNDTLVFVLHTLPGENLGNILALVPSPAVVFDPAVMEYDVTYYLSAVVGNATVSGIDLNDPCGSVAVGQPVIFVESLSGVLNFIQGEEVLCQGEDLFLSTNILTSFDLVYHWILPGGDTIVTATADLLIENIQPSAAGDYYVFVQDQSCLFDQTGPFTLQVLGLALGERIAAGRDTVICENEYTLNAAAISGGLGTWLGPSGVRISNLNAARTQVSNLAEGINQFIWTVRTTDCGTIGSDTLTIIVASGLRAADDFFTLEQANTEIFMDVLKNDGLAPATAYTLRALSEPAFGSLRTLNNGFQYLETEGQRGTVTFEYEVCYATASCASSCATATVTIEVLNLPYLPEGFTPNNDGRNDALEVLGYRGGGEVSMKLQITNRWGDIVYYAKDYLQEPPWNGHLNNRKQALPESTYYAWMEITVDGVVYQRSQALYVVY